MGRKCGELPVFMIKNSVKYAKDFKNSTPLYKYRVKSQKIKIPYTDEKMISHKCFVVHLA